MSHSESLILDRFPLGLHWPTLDPFLFVAHHLDVYPPGNENLGVDPHHLRGRNIGSDFELRDGWRMYHGREVPGFPRHPHRGFETISIVSQGFVDHSDSMGATARFGEGDVQWMTAGAGVVHSEMFPLLDKTQKNPGELFQIWLNLPSNNKMVAPYFTMFWADQVPKVKQLDSDGKGIVVLPVVGAFDGQSAPPPPSHSWAAPDENGVQVWRILMEPGAHWTLPASGPDIDRMLYFHEGTELNLGGTELDSKTGVRLSASQSVALINGTTSAELLLLSGRAIKEPVAHHGPFVMNTRAELQQAFIDYRETEFGGWPWSSDDPVHSAERRKFAVHADGRQEGK